MLVRVWYVNGEVFKTECAAKSEREYDDIMERTRLYLVSQGLMSDSCDYEDMDDSQLPDKKYREAWIGSKEQGVSIDQMKKAEIDARPVYTEEEEAQIQAKLRDMAAKELGI